MQCLHTKGYNPNQLFLKSQIQSNIHFSYFTFWLWAVAASEKWTWIVVGREIVVAIFENSLLRMNYSLNRTKL